MGLHVKVKIGERVVMDLPVSLDEPKNVKSISLELVEEAE